MKSVWIIKIKHSAIYYWVSEKNVVGKTASRAVWSLEGENINSGNKNVFYQCGQLMSKHWVPNPCFVTKIGNLQINKVYRRHVMPLFPSPFKLHLFRISKAEDPCDFVLKLMCLKSLSYCRIKSFDFSIHGNKQETENWESLETFIALTILLMKGLRLGKRRKKTILRFEKWLICENVFFREHQEGFFIYQQNQLKYKFV